MNHDFVILTDSACDLGPALLKKRGINSVDLTFHRQGSTDSLINADMPGDTFYRQMREGIVFQTSAVGIGAYLSFFRQYLEAGKDILFIGLSGNLSSTVSFAKTASDELLEEFPNRRIRVMDSKCASGGEGLLILLAAMKQDEGASLTQTADYVQEMIPHLCHWFTVDDLVYLKRGGRVRAGAAFAATILNIKPVLHMDDEGSLIPRQKVRGRKSAIKTLADMYDKLAIDPDHGVYMISQADCIEDARALETLIFHRHGHKAAHILDLSSVIGSHSGPGTIALFFPGIHR